MENKIPDAAKVLTDTPLINAAGAPLIYFEAVSNQGGIGIVNVTLVAFLHLPNKEGGVDSVPSTVAHLRCPRDVAIALRNSLDTAIKNGEPPPTDASVN